MELGVLVFSIIALVVGILITRALGAWMLRINDVIAEQKETNRLLNILIEKQK